MEPNPETMQSVAEHRENPTEEAAVKSSGARKKRHMGPYITVGRRGETKERTWGNCISRGKDSPCRSGTAQGTRPHRIRRGKYGKKNPERMYIREETSAEIGMQQWH
jgi:hypothetical protein